MDRDMQELLKWDPNPDYEEEEETEEEEIVVSDDIPADNITSDDVRATEQALLYLVIDKSGSMFNNGLEEAVRDSLKQLKDTVKKSIECDEVQIALTFFGSSMDMRGFQYWENVDTSYEASEEYTRLYDAIVKSANNMLHQYETMEVDNLVKGAMLIITDGAENGSQEHTENDVKEALEKLKTKKIPVVLATFDKVDMSKFAKKIGNVQLESFKDAHDLRRKIAFHTNPKAI